jgi:hypothetical protein
MLDWTRAEQLGFCFHLYDHNGDGFICIQDLFELMKEFPHKTEEHIEEEMIQELLKPSFSTKPAPNTESEHEDRIITIRDDLTNLVELLRFKAKRMCVQSHISPSIYGVYDNFDNNKDDNRKELENENKLRFSRYKPFERDYEKE